MFIRRNSGILRISAPNDEDVCLNDVASIKLRALSPSCKETCIFRVILEVLKDCTQNPDFPLQSRLAVSSLTCNRQQNQSAAAGCSRRCCSENDGAVNELLR